MSTYLIKNRHPASSGSPRGAAQIASSETATGQASVRLPLPDPAVLQKLAKAFEPWLR